MVARNDAMMRLICSFHCSAINTFIDFCEGRVFTSFAPARLVRLVLVGRRCGAANCRNWKFGLWFLRTGTTSVQPCRILERNHADTGIHSKSEPNWKSSRLAIREPKRRAATRSRSARTQTSRPFQCPPHPPPKGCGAQSRTQYSGLFVPIRG